MHLVYFDESGNTGNNLNDLQQPVFVLAALIVSEHVWIEVEQQLQAVVDRYFPPPQPDNFEIHATELRNGRGIFSDISVADRVALREEWLGIAQKYDLKLVYRALVKRRYQRWLQSTRRGLINPHVVAFPLVAQVINQYLHTLPDQQLGIFILDENQEIVKDVEKSIRELRELEGTLRLDRIIEKGFFIDSAKSLLLQLCDLCALNARKKEEAKAGLTIRSIDEGGIAGIEPLIHRGSESLQDVLGWIAEQNKAE